MRAFINAPSPKSIIFVRGTTEGINLVAKAWGRRNVSKGDEIVITHLEHHANIVPWQQLAAEKGAKLRVAPVDDSGQIMLEEYEKLLKSEDAHRLVHPGLERARHHHAGAGDGRDGAPRTARSCSSTARSRSRTCRSTCRRSTPTSSCSPATRCSPRPASASSTAQPSMLEAMPPWQGGGNMIADVTFEKTTFQGPPQRFEAGTGNIADAVGLGAAIDYSRASA